LSELHDEVAADEPVDEAAELSDEIVFPNFDIEVPPDVLAELEEDDPAEVTDEDLSAFSAQYGEDNDPELLRRLAAAERRAAHLEALRVKEAKKNWKEEAVKFFPLSEPFLDEINSNSRRGFLRTAKQLNDRMKPLIEEKVLKPARAAREAELAAVQEEAKGKARDAWGTPVQDEEANAAPVVVQQEARRRKRGEFSDVVRGMLFPKE
jgi:hypothetical protein